MKRNLMNYNNPAFDYYQLPMQKMQVLKNAADSILIDCIGAVLHNIKLFGSSNVNIHSEVSQEILNTGLSYAEEIDWVLYYILQDSRIIPSHNEELMKLLEEVANIQNESKCTISSKGT